MTKHTDQTLDVYLDVLDSVVKSHSADDDKDRRDLATAHPASDRAVAFADVLRRHPTSHRTKRAPLFWTRRVVMEAGSTLWDSDRIIVRVHRSGAVSLTSRTGSVLVSSGSMTLGQGFSSMLLAENAEGILVTAFRAFIKRSIFGPASAIMDAVLGLDGELG